VLSCAEERRAYDAWRARLIVAAEKVGVAPREYLVWKWWTGTRDEDEAKRAKAINVLARIGEEAESEEDEPTRATETPVVGDSGGGREKGGLDAVDYDEKIARAREVEEEGRLGSVGIGPNKSADVLREVGVAEKQAREESVCYFKLGFSFCVLNQQTQVTV
jgi:hypothetical protein